MREEETQQQQDQERQQRAVGKNPGEESCVLQISTWPLFPVCAAARWPASSMWHNEDGRAAWRCARCAPSCPIPLSEGFLWVSHTCTDYIWNASVPVSSPVYGKKSASKADRNVHAPLTGCFECLNSDLFDVIALKTNWILNLNKVIHHQQSLKRRFTKRFLQHLHVVDVVESWMFIFYSSERFI